MSEPQTDLFGRATDTPLWTSAQTITPAPQSIEAPPVVWVNPTVSAPQHCVSCDRPAADCICADDPHSLDPRSVMCPTCGADIGRPCKRPSGHTVFGGESHAKRYQLAEAVALGDDDEPHPVDAFPDLS